MASVVQESRTSAANAPTKASLEDLAIFGGTPAFKENLHVGRPNIGNRERFHERVADILDRKWLTNGGRYLVCPICFDARGLDKGVLLPNAELGGTVPMWQWIGEDHAVTFSY